MADIFTEFIPEQWSGNILQAKDKVHVFAKLANRNYEGEISGAGDKVRIPQVGDITVNSYTRNNFGTGLTLENPNIASIFLTIDQEKYFAVTVDTIDIKQSKPKFVEELQRKAAYAVADTQDQFVAGLYGQAGLSSTSNSATSYVTIGSSNIRAQLLLLGKTFDAGNVQKEGRYLVVPPAFMYEAIDAGILEQSNNDQLWQSAKMMNAYGWDLIMSNNVSSPSTDTDQYRIIAGVANESLTMAEQILETEMVKLVQSLKGFGVALTGLHVYGARFIPDRTGVLYAKITND